MVRQMMAVRRVRVVGVTLAVLAGLTAGATCMDDSPMAFSPDGRNLAFVTMEPWDAEADGLAAGPQLFRLMVLGPEGRLRVLDQTADALLAAPAYSPDGRHLAYLRVPLPSALEQEQACAQLERRFKQLEELVDPAWREWASAHTSESPATTQAAGWANVSDQMLPPFQTLLVHSYIAGLTSPVAASLVVRDASTGGVVRTVAIELPVFDYGRLYVDAQMSYGPGGGWLYLCAGGLAVAIDPQTGHTRLLAAGTEACALSPDGRTLAVRWGPVVGLIDTDGQAAAYRRLPGSVASGAASWADIAWTDAQTLVVLAGKLETASEPAHAAAPTVVMHRLRRDGTLLEPIRIPLPATQDASDSQGPIKDVTSRVAVSSDGRHVVVTGESGTWAAFATPDGQVLRLVRDEELVHLRPTCSPDSRRVAFKRMREVGEKRLRMEAITFYTPQGQPLQTVTIPPIDPTSTRPATTQPSVQPSTGE